MRSGNETNSVAAVTLENGHYCMRACLAVSVACSSGSTLQHFCSKVKALLLTMIPCVDGNYTNSHLFTRQW